MPIRTSPIPHPASSFSNTTPQLDSRWGHHDSSSSPGMVLATPTDAARYGVMRAPKEMGGARRSVRVRTASGGRNESSPQVLLPDPPSSMMDYPVLHEAPTRPRPSRTSSNTSNGNNRSRASQASASHPQHPVGEDDQYEDARQQVMRFLRTDAAAPQATSSPSAQEKGKGRQQLGRSASSASNGSYSTTHGAASMTNVGSTSAHLNGGSSVHEQDHAPRNLRSHSSVDSSMYEQHARMDQESRKEQQLRRWAQEESSSSDEEGADADPHYNFGSAQRAPSSSAPGLLPSPSFVHDSHASGPAPSPASLQTSLAKRGMMERFMSDRGTPQQDDEGHQSTASTSALVLPQARTVFSPGESPRHAGKRNATASPPLRTATDYSPNAVPTSPAPSRGTGPGVLFSPDVAKLLRSELDELEANEQSTKRRTSARRRAEETDISVDEYSSPFAENSPFPGQSAKRSRDVFIADESDASKRTRWVNFVPDEVPRAASPTPSATSHSLRAPSFCDSSPAVSEKASTSAGRPTYASNTTHPASAPDFLYHGLPSSSPASSQHSSSDYAPPRHRSSPGPSTAVHIPLQRTQSSASAPVETTGRKQRGPLKRADTMPSLMGHDGHQKPHWSYAALIGQAIFSTETLKMSLAEVYQYIMTCYPYYKKEDSGWQNSIRHNLSLNECFVKTQRGPDNPGKGCLWAIAAGCEDQFADGNFVKKGGQGNGRKPKGAKAAAAAAASTSGAAAAAPTTVSKSSSGSWAAPAPSKSDSAHLLKSAVKRGRDDSPAASSGRGASPAGSAVSSSSYRPSQPVSNKAPSPSPSPALAAAPAPAPLTRTRSTGSTRQKRSPIVVEQQPPPPPPPPHTLQRRDSIISNTSTHLTAPTSPTAALSPPATIVEREEHEEHQQASKKVKLVGPHERPSLQPAFDNRLAVATITASPPTSVYHRLAGPYQPISYAQGSPYNHRALALLASPEASGIMPVHPADFGRPSLHQVPSHSASSSIDSNSGMSHFLPAPHIFPGSAGRRSRSEDGEDKEEREPQSMLSPTALVHTQSPISSIRGNPRAPMSPLQASDEKSFSSTSALASFSIDPEKKRAAGLRHIPAVAAIADASFAAETFRSPPPSVSSRGHLRSPSGKSFGGAFATALMSTPGARMGGRAWGMSPGVGAGDGSWGFGGDLEAELERFGAAGEQVMGSGGSALGGAPRLYWPSPGMGNHGAW